MNTVKIDERYSVLAEDACCLSCGGAINHSEVKEGEVCVDIGSGRGTDAIRLANIAGDSGYVYGIDIAEGMLNKRRKSHDGSPTFDKVVEGIETEH